MDFEYGVKELDNHVIFLFKFNLHTYYICNKVDFCPCKESLRATNLIMKKINDYVPNYAGVFYSPWYKIKPFKFPYSCEN